MGRVETEIGFAARQVQCRSGKRHANRLGTALIAGNSGIYLKEGGLPGFRVTDKLYAPYACIIKFPDKSLAVLSERGGNSYMQAFSGKTGPVMLIGPCDRYLKQ